MDVSVWDVVSAAIGAALVLVIQALTARLIRRIRERRKRGELF